MVVTSWEGSRWCGVQLQLFALASILLLAVVWAIVRRYGSRLPEGTRLPPIPPTHFFGGHLSDIPAKRSWLKYHEWSQQHGPIYRVRLGRKIVHIVCSDKIANTLLRDRGNVYSSRDVPGAQARFLGEDLRPFWWTPSKRLQQGRQLMYQVCRESAAITYQPTHTLEAIHMLRDLLRRPEDYEEWFVRYASSLIFRLCYGKAIQSKEDPFLRRILAVNAGFGRVGQLGTYLMDTFPVIMRLPTFLAPGKAELLKIHKMELSLYRELLNDIKGQMAVGTAPDCWEKTYIEHMNDYMLSEDQGAFIMGTMFAAGAHTTAATMKSFMLCMLLYPQHFDNLQKTVDAVVGSERLPDYTDVPKLPLLRAVIKEVMRMRPLPPGGVPHKSVKDDVFEGYFIPAGSIIQPNVWSIHRDPSVYPRPDEFLPERWLDARYPTYKEPLTEYPTIKNYSAFGYGRRICPGYNIVEKSLCIQAAYIVWACTLTKKTFLDCRSHGLDEENFKDGATTEPDWFPFELSPRSARHQEIVDDAFQEWKKNDPLRRPDDC